VCLCRLLRARRERPRGAAEQRDKLAAFHLIIKALPMPVSVRLVERRRAEANKRPIFHEALNST
jgi:hypothetical protein